MSKKSEERGEERKGKVKVGTAVSLLNPKTVEILHSAHAHSTSFKTRFSAKSPGANGLKAQKSAALRGTHCQILSAGRGREPSQFIDEKTVKTTWSRTTHKSVVNGGKGDK